MESWSVCALGGAFSFFSLFLRWLHWPQRRRKRINCTNVLSCLSTKRQKSESPLAEGRKDGVSAVWRRQEERARKKKIFLQKRENQCAFDLLDTFPLRAHKDLNSSLCAKRKLCGNPERRRWCTARGNKSIAGRRRSLQSAGATSAVCMKKNGIKNENKWKTSKEVPAKSLRKENLCKNRQGKLKKNSPAKQIIHWRAWPTCTRPVTRSHCHYTRTHTYIYIFVEDCMYMALMSVKQANELRRNGNEFTFVARLRVYTPQGKYVQIYISVQTVWIKCCVPVLARRQWEKDERAAPWRTLTVWR